MLIRTRPSKWWTTRALLIPCAFVVVMCIFCLLFSQQLEADYGYLGMVDPERLSLPSLMATPRESLGQQIVQKAFHESYSYLVDFCGDLNHTPFQGCLRRLYDLQTQKNSSVATKWPWWFHTMIRDSRVPQAGLFGPWHYLEFKDPTMQVCVFEKCGTKMWRTMHCKYMENRGMNLSGTSLTTCYRIQGQIQTDHVERSVFLRDPLERFLSGFLDKCLHQPHRLQQPHCQPSAIFKDVANHTVAEFFEQGQKLFEVHVDVSPLKWDLHFFPTSFQCGGLYQKIKDYDFVGKMDDTFYQELGRFTDRYPKLKSDVQLFFKTQGKENATNLGTEHQAALKARKYFTPNTVRKVLQYYSIDYMLLGLDIPLWAEDILKQDETFLV